MVLRFNNCAKTVEQSRMVSVTNHSQLAFTVVYRTLSAVNISEHICRSPVPWLSRYSVGLQTCAKIPKRSKIQDPLDPRSWIQVDLGSSSSGFVEGSRGSWIQHFRFCERSYGSWIQHIRFCERSYGSWILLFNFFRGILSIFADFITLMTYFCKIFW